MKDILSAVQGIIVKLLPELLESNIKLESDIYYDIGLDSLYVVDTVILIEEEFNIDITNKELMSISTINDLVKIIENKLD